MISGYTDLSSSEKKKNRTYVIDVDAGDILSEDMTRLRESIVKLHDFCMAEDVALDVVSRIRSDFTAHANGYESRAYVVVTIDGTKTYAVPSHPNAASLEYDIVSERIVSHVKDFALTP